MQQVLEASTLARLAHLASVPVDVWVQTPLLSWGFDGALPEATQQPRENLPFFRRGRGRSSPQLSPTAPAEARFPIKFCHFYDPQNAILPAFFTHTAQWRRSNRAAQPQGVYTTAVAVSTRAHAQVHQKYTQS